MCKRHAAFQYPSPPPQARRKQPVLAGSRRMRLVRIQIRTLAIQAIEDENPEAPPCRRCGRILPPCGARWQANAQIGLVDRPIRSSARSYARAPRPAERPAPIPGGDDIIALTHDRGLYRLAELLSHDADGSERRLSPNATRRRGLGKGRTFRPDGKSAATATYLVASRDPLPTAHRVLEGISITPNNLPRHSVERRPCT
jgi:hypothetical protein